MSPWIANLIEAILRLAGRLAEIWFAFRAGQSSERGAQTQEEARIKDEQAKIASQRPHDRRELAERLRNEGL